MAGDDQLSLFDVPSQPAGSGGLPRRPVGRGRARETYVREVVVDVAIVDEAALKAAALRYLDEGPKIALSFAGEDDGVPVDDGEDEDGDGPDPRGQVSENAAAAVGWLVWPTAGLADLTEAGAFRCIDLDLRVGEVSPTQCRVTWSVTIKLEDVTALRETALALCPPKDLEAQVEVDKSLAAAWNRAADPFAPIRDVPGITWTSHSLVVKQIYARAGRS